MCFLREQGLEISVDSFQAFSEDVSATLRGQRDSAVCGETLTDSTQVQGVMLNKVKQMNQETFPGTRGSSKRGCSCSSSSLLLKIVHQVNVILVWIMTIAS